MTEKQTDVGEKVVADKWQSGDQLIQYNRVSPLVRWSKRFLWFLVLFVLPTSICFVLWWTGLPESRRRELITEYPRLQVAEERIPAEWHRAVAPPEKSPQPDQAAAQVPPKKKKPKPTPVKKPVPNAPVVAYQPPHKITVTPDSATINERTTVVGDREKIKMPGSGDDMQTMSLAEYDQWREQVANANTKREELARGYLDNGGLLLSWKVWEKKRPLNWDDFRNPSVDNKNNWGGFVSLGISMTRGRLTHHAFAYMVPEESWNRPGYYSEYGLRHEQAHFDITELYARKLRSRLAALRPLSDRDAYRMYLETLEEHTLMQRDYDQQTVHGSLRDAQERWLKDIEVAMVKFAEWAWIPSWKNMANANHHDAQFYMAQAYANGTDGFPQSDKLAKSWYARAISNGSEEAANNLGVMNLLGLVPKASDKRAFRYFKKAATRSSIGEFNLAMMYLKGKGTKPSRERALEWLTKSAQRFTLSQMALIELEQAPPESETPQQNASQ